MEEKMEKLEKMVKVVGDYCDENKIEYLFSATDNEGTSKLIHNVVTSPILKESISILGKIVGLK